MGFYSHRTESSRLHVSMYRAWLAGRGETGEVCRQWRWNWAEEGESSVRKVWTRVAVAWLPINSLHHTCMHYLSPLMTPCPGEERGHMLLRRRAYDINATGQYIAELKTPPGPGTGEQQHLVSTCSSNIQSSARLAGWHSRASAG